MLEAVKESLDASEFSMTVTEVKVQERERRMIEVYRGHEYPVDLVQELQISIIVHDEDVRTLPI